MGLGISQPLLFQIYKIIKIKYKLMKKSSLFLLIVGIGLVAYLLWPVVVALTKIAIVIGVVAIFAAFGWLVWYIARETSKHN